MSKQAVKAPPILQLSSLVSRPLRDSDGERLGRVEDVIVRLGGVGYPPITGFLVKVAGRASYLGIDRVSDIGSSGVVLSKAFKNIRPIFRERGKINAEVQGRLTESLGGVRVVLDAASKRTVDFHINNARLKLHATTRAEAAIKAVADGLIKPEADL